MKQATMITMLLAAFSVPSAMAKDDGYSVTAKSLEYEDIRAAVQDVRSRKPDGHGTVYLPAGDADWGHSPSLQVHGGINLIGHGIDQTTIRWSHNQPLISYNAYEEREEDLDFSGMRVSGISFVADESSRGVALNIRSVERFRVDHVLIETSKKSAYMMFIRSTRSYHPRPYGVIDHCTFKANGAMTYGVYIGPYRWPNGNRDYLEFLGKLENVFIEDCTFENLGHHFALFDGGCVVFRHNTCTSDGDASIIDSHELSGSIKDAKGIEQEHGGRCMEVYENTFQAPPGKEHSYVCLRTRNGGGVLFNNTLRDPRYAFIFVYGARTVESTKGVYPGLDQIHFWWIWGNDVQNVRFPGIHKQEGGKYSKLNIQEDRDYFLRAPDPTISHPEDALQPGFREPDYKPYPYPHPLVETASSN